MRFVAGLCRTSSAPVELVPVILSVHGALYGRLFAQSPEPNIPLNMLFRYGAMESDALNRGAYWRLSGAGLLHPNPLHLLGNLLCLVIWGSPLEKRLGAPY